MLTIELEGARALLDLLAEIQAGGAPDEQAVWAVMDANAFFVDFYSGWEGCNRETLARAIRHFNQPALVPPGELPKRLAEGFRRAVAEREQVENRMEWLKAVDTAGIAERILTLLPQDTPLDATIHITVDLFNNAFAQRSQIGISVLYGAMDRKTFETVVMHELHHVGFHFWSDRDATRQRLLGAKNGRAMAVLHVQNLLMEGLANYYCSPDYVFSPAREAAAGADDDPYQARLMRMQREEAAFFRQAEAALETCLEPGTDDNTGWEAFKTIALDLEDMMLPAGHYLGARMVQTAAQAYPQSQIVGWVQALQDFLPGYNAAAQKSGGFIFNRSLVSRFTHLWSQTGETAVEA